MSKKIIKSLIMMIMMVATLILLSTISQVCFATPNAIGSKFTRHSSARISILK